MTPTRTRHARGFTLMEALMAAAILFAGMLAVMAAITTGQQSVFEAELQLDGTLLAEAKMQEMIQGDYNALSPSYEDLPYDDGALSRLVNVETMLHEVPSLGVWVRGKQITITIFHVAPNGADVRTLAELKAFIPEPST